MFDTTVLGSRCERLILGCVIVCLLLGTALRFYGADVKSLNGDEIWTLSDSHDLGGVFVSRPTSQKGWLPVQFVLLHLAMLLGHQEFILRFPAIACGILSLAVVYKLCRRMFGPAPGLVALFLLAISPFHIVYSQYIRYYSYFILFAALVYYFLYDAVARGKRWAWIGLAISVSLALRTQYIARVILITQGVVGVSVLSLESLVYLTLVLVDRWRQARHKPAVMFPERMATRRLAAQWINFILCQALIVILNYHEIVLVLLNYYAPQLSSAWGTSQAGASRWLSFPTPALAPPSLVQLSRATLLSIVDAFSDGNEYDKLPLWALYPFVGFWCVGWAAACLRCRWRQVLLASLAIVMPLVALYVVNVEAEYGMGARYLCFLLPFYWIPIAYGITALVGMVKHTVMCLLRLPHALPPRLLGWLAWGAALIFGLLSLGGFVRLDAYSLRPWYNYESQNWRDVIKLLSAFGLEDECAVFGYPDVLNFYTWPGYHPCPSRDLTRALSQYEGVWYVQINAQVDQATEQILQDKGFASVIFDGYWGKGIRVAYWRRDSSQAELGTQLAKTAVAVNPRDPSLLVTVGRNYLAAGDTDISLDYYRRALQLRPDYQAAYKAVLNYDAQQWQAERSEIWLEYAFARNPYSIWPHNLRGQFYQDRGMTRAALDDFRRAVEMAPYETGDSYWRLGRLYQQLGRSRDEVDLYRMAVRYNPDEMWAHQRLAETLRRLGEWAEAAVEYERAIDLNPADPGVYMALAGVYEKLGQEDVIPTLYQRAIRSNPVATWPLVELGDFYLARGDVSSALASYIQANSLDPAAEAPPQRIQSARWTLAAHLADVHASSSSGARLTRQTAQAWIKPYPNTPLTLVSAAPLAVRGHVQPDQVLFHPFGSNEDTIITFTIQANPYLALFASYSLADEAIGSSDGVDYQLELSTDGGETFEPLVEVMVGQNAWLSQTISLAPYWERDLIFRLTASARENDVYDWLLIKLELQPYAGVWNLVENARNGIAQCGTIGLGFSPRGFRYRGQWLITRSMLPVQGVVHPTQIQFHPCNSSKDTTFRFSLKNNPYAALKTSYGLADLAASRSRGVGYTVAVSTTLSSAPLHLLEAQVSKNEWQDAYLDLTPYLGQDVTLILTSSALGDEQYDWLQIQMDMFPPLLQATPEALSRVVDNGLSE